MHEHHTGERSARHVFTPAAVVVVVVVSSVTALGQAARRTMHHCHGSVHTRITLCDRLSGGHDHSTKLRVRSLVTSKRRCPERRAGSRIILTERMR